MKNVKFVKNMKWLKPLICETYEECEKYEENPIKPWEGCTFLLSGVIGRKKLQTLFTPSTTELRPHMIIV